MKYNLKDKYQNHTICLKNVKIIKGAINLTFQKSINALKKALTFRAFFNIHLH